jgi:hypothetical protein
MAVPGCPSCAARQPARVAQPPGPTPGQLLTSPRSLPASCRRDASQEAIQTLVRLFQRFEFEIDGAMTPCPPPLRPGITLGFRDGLWCRVRERGCGAAAAAQAPEP